MKASLLCFALFLTPACDIAPSQTLQDDMLGDGMVFDMDPAVTWAEMTVIEGGESRAVKLPVATAQLGFRALEDGALEMQNSIFTFDTMPVEPPPGLPGVELGLSSIELAVPRWKGAQVAWQADECRAHGQAELAIGWRMDGRTLVLPQKNCDLHLLAVRREPDTRYVKLELPGIFFESAHIAFADFVFVGQARDGLR